MSSRARHRFGTCAAVAAALLAVGCNRKALQPPDATGSGGSLAFDGGRQDGVTPSTDAGVDSPVDWPTFDALPDLPPDGPLFAGARSFLVVSQLQRDGGVGTFPSSHGFTMTVNGDQRTAIVGGGREAAVHPLEPVAGGSLRIPLPVRFSLPNSCAGSSVTYNDFRFAIDGSGVLRGTGQGQVVVVSGDVASTAPATMSLTGVADTTPPWLSLDGNFADPFGSWSVVSSEPLRPDAAVTLRAKDGETTALSAGGIPGTFVTNFQKPARALRYGTVYGFLSGPLADFAGNAAEGLYGTTFMTWPLPPLAAEDGFEGVATTTFGEVPVLSGAGAPTITGATSLYIAPVPSFGTQQPLLALRLQLTPGDTVIRFSFRTVTPGTWSGPGFSYGVGFTVGSEGGTFTTPTLPADPNTARTPAMIGGVEVSLGPVMTATFPLPPDTTAEVVLTRTHNGFNSCGFPQPTTAGIIIDDLRAE